MSLTEREIHTSATRIIALGLWVVSLSLLFVSWEVDDRYMAILAVICAIGGGTATVRRYFIEQAEQIRLALQVTGRDHSSKVKPLR